MMILVKHILFVCVHNSGRSQMAQALLNAMASGKAVADSAGTQPAEHVNPVVAQVMREVDFEIAEQRPKMITIEMMETADRVISMGAAFRNRALPAWFRWKTGTWMTLKGSPWKT